MSAPPWMKFNCAHFVADTMDLSCEERGAYIALIIFYWQKGSLPNDDEKLARIVGLDAMRWQCVRNAMTSLFLANWRHKRIDAELARANEKSKKATYSANNRWKDKQKSDNANAKRRHMPTQCDGNAIETTDLTTANAVVGASRGKRTKPRSQIEPNALPTPADVQAGKDEGMDRATFSSEWKRFRDHHCAKGSVMADWGAAWRTWLGNRKRFGTDERKQSVQDAGRDLAERAAAGLVDFGPVPPPYMPPGSSGPSSGYPSRMLSEGGCGEPRGIRGERGFGPVLLSATSGLPGDGPTDGPSGDEQVASDSQRGEGRMRG